MIMRAILTMLALLLVAGGAQAAPRGGGAGCAASKPAGAVGYWRYRVVAGRKCWYPARSGRVSVTQIRRSAVPVYREDEYSPLDERLDREQPRRLPTFFPAIPNPLAIEPRDFDLRWRGR